MRQLPITLAAACVPMMLTACTLIWVNIPAREKLTTPPAALMAGAARIDITPIPGIPMGGFSASGKLSRGVWSRLHARAIYVVDIKGNPLVLVSTDLLQMPTGLADRIAELVGDDENLAHIGRENLVLAATHTHHGPAAFFSSRLNTSLTSPSPVPGFDREIFEFLARRIQQAIAQAVATAVPAALFVNHVGDADPLDNLAKDLFRNRSVDAFLLNRDARPYLADASPTLAGCPRPQDYPNPLSCLAVNPNVEVLSFVRASDTSRVIAVAGFLASHPTVLGAQTEVYSGDLLGASASLLEQQKIANAACPKRADDPVVAFFNGAQGDVSPAWMRRDRADLIELAEKLGQKVCSLLPGTQIPLVEIGFQFRVVDDLRDRDFDEPTPNGSFERHTARRARPGEPQLGGAEDGRTLFYETGFQEGRRAKSRDEHGPKQQAIEPLGDLVFFFSPPPRRAPLGVYTIGPLAIASLPGEFTTMMGERVRQQVSDQMAASSQRPDRVLLAGLTGGHVSYVTTPEEYDAQHFEGASNFYGAATGPFLAHKLEALSAHLPQSTEPAAASRIYVVSQARRFKPADVWGPPYLVDDGFPQLARDLVSPHRPRRDFPAFCFYDAVPRLDSVGVSGGDCSRAMPEVSILHVATDTVVADAAGLEILTVMVGVERERTEWCAIWLVPEETRTDTTNYGFRAARIRGADANSKPFVPADIFASPGGIPFLDRRASEDLQPPSVFGYNTCEEVDPFP